MPGTPKRRMAKNNPITRTKSRRVDKAAKALMSDFKVTDLKSNDKPTGHAPDMFSGGTPTQVEAARGAMKNLTDSVVNALGINQGRVNVDLGDGLKDPETGRKMFGRRR